MANIAASNVTFAFANSSKYGSKDDNSVRQEKVTVSFGNGTLTYPAGGVPLSGLTNWGFPNKIDEVITVDMSSPDGFVYKYSSANNSLRIYEQNATTGALIEVTSGSFAPAATSLVLFVRGH